MKKNTIGEYIPSVADLYKLAQKLLKDDLFMKYPDIISKYKYITIDGTLEPSQKMILCVFLINEFLNKFGSISGMQYEIIESGGRLNVFRPSSTNCHFITQSIIDDNFSIKSEYLNDVWNILYGSDYNGE